MALTKWYNHLSPTVSSKYLGDLVHALIVEPVALRSFHGTPGREMALCICRVHRHGVDAQHQGRQLWCLVQKHFPVAPRAFECRVLLKEPLFIQVRYALQR